VENETLACGTGVTACAIAYVYRTGKIGDHLITIKVQGGELKVRFQYDGTVFTNVWLIGPGTFVFEGTIDV
jgi:diaminopimelate epimerase